MRTRRLDLKLELIQSEQSIFNNWLSGYPEGPAIIQPLLPVGISPSWLNLNVISPPQRTEPWSRGPVSFTLHGIVRGVFQADEGNLHVEERLAGCFVFCMQEPGPARGPSAAETQLSSFNHDDHFRLREDSCPCRCSRRSPRPPGSVRGIRGVDRSRTPSCSTCSRPDAPRANRVRAACP